MDETKLSMAFMVLYRIPTGTFKNVMVIADSFKEVLEKALAMFGKNLVSIAWTAEKNPYYISKVAEKNASSGKN